MSVPNLRYRFIFTGCIALVIAPASHLWAAAFDDWLGVWANGDNKIRLSARDGKIFADGSAYYPYENFVPFPSVGEFQGSGLPKKGRLTIRDGFREQVYCTVIMTHTGDKLTVLNHDPGCGGHNVSFQGVYHRVADKIKASPAPR